MCGSREMGGGVESEDGVDCVRETKRARVTGASGVDASDADTVGVGEGDPVTGAAVSGGVEGDGDKAEEGTGEEKEREKEGEAEVEVAGQGQGQGQEEDGEWEAVEPVEFREGLRLEVLWVLDEDGKDVHLWWGCTVLGKDGVFEGEGEGVPEAYRGRVAWKLAYDAFEEFAAEERRVVPNPDGCDVYDCAEGVAMHVRADQSGGGESEDEEGAEEQDLGSVPVDQVCAEGDVVPEVVMQMVDPILSDPSVPHRAKIEAANMVSQLRNFIQDVKDKAAEGETSVIGAEHVREFFASLKQSRQDREYA